MTDTNNQQQTSPFFKLPREVRDKIYSYLPNDYFKFDDTSDDKGWLFIHGYILLNPCLVSRQFSSEYREQILRDTRVEIDLRAGDRARFERAVSSAGVRSLLAQVRNVTVFYYDQYSGARTRKLPAQHEDVYTYLKYLPSVKSLTMTLTVLQHYETRAFQANASQLATFDAINAQFLSLPMPTHFQGTTERKVYLQCQLFSLARTTADAKHCDHLERSPEEVIVYWATPSDDPYAWRGLALRVLRSGSFEGFERWKAGFDAEWKAAMSAN